MNAIPYSDAARLAGIGRRTTGIRVAAGLTVLGLVIAFALLSRHPHTQTIVSLPQGANAIVVLDLSASISSDTFSRIGNTLDQLASSRRRYALIVFSDQAYEALPPGTPGADLRPLVRYFTLPPQKTPGALPTFPANPWQSTFSAGTRISAGMGLARELATSRVKRPVVILISDLDDDPRDVPALSGVLASYQRDNIPVRIVGLNPSPTDTALFQRLLGSTTPVVQASLPGTTSAPRNNTPFPWVLLALGLAAALVLAAHEAWGPTLRWGHPR
jgi:hypothetical protein